jgi:hypothetical protein
MRKYKVWIGASWIFETYAHNEREARENAREWLGVKRLPNDTFVEVANPQEERRMLKHNEAVNREVLRANPWLCSTDL